MLLVRQRTLQDRVMLVSTTICTHKHPALQLMQPGAQPLMVGPRQQQPPNPHAKQLELYTRCALSGMVEAAGLRTLACNTHPKMQTVRHQAFPQRLGPRTRADWQRFQGRQLPSPLLQAWHQQLGQAAKASHCSGAALAQHGAHVDEAQRLNRGYLCRRAGAVRQSCRSFTCMRKACRLFVGTAGADVAW